MVLRAGSQPLQQPLQEVQAGAAQEQQLQQQPVCCDYLFACVCVCAEHMRVRVCVSRSEPVRVCASRSEPVRVCLILLLHVHQPGQHT